MCPLLENAFKLILIKSVFCLIAKGCDTYIYIDILQLHLLTYIFESSILRLVREYLSKEPFQEFLSSMYFKRLMQWKWLES